MKGRWFGLVGMLVGGAALASEVLVIGRISDDPKAHDERMRPILNYVVSKLGDAGIREGRVLMARDSQQMISYLRQGKVDWLSETAGAALGLSERTGAQIVLRSRRGGLSQYHSVFFTRNSAPIQTLADLPGHSLGFQHPMSTSAYLVPAALLLERGFNLAIQASPLDRPPPNFIGYTFARAESNLVTWVQKGLVDAAAMSNQDWDELVVPVAALKSDLRIFHQSEPFPRGFELFRAGLAPRVAERLRAVLLAAHNDPDAAAALKAYQGTERFDPVDAAMLTSLDALKVGVERVRNQIE
jgi:phosphonate transport system substrate-binding protein